MTKKRPKLTFKDLLKHLNHSFRRIGSHLNINSKLFFRSRLTTFLFIFFPLIILLLFGSIFIKQGRFSYDLTIQNKDNSVAALELVDNLENNELLKIDYLTDLEIDALNYLKEENKHACLVIPENWFTTSLLNPTSNVILILNPYISTSERIVHIVTKTINEFNIETNGTDPLINLETKTFSSDYINYIDFFLPGILSVIILNIGIIGTMLSQTNFMKNGIFRKYATTPLTRVEYFFADIIWQFGLTFVAILLVVFSAWIIFGFSWSSFTAMIIPIIIIGNIMFYGIGLLLSQIFKNPNNVIATGVLVSIPMLFLSGIFYDVTNITALNVLSKISPLTYIVEAIRASMITKNLSIAGMNLGIALAIGIISVIVGLLLTKWERN